MGDISNTLLENSKSTPLALSALIGSSDRYITSNEISKLAIEKYKTKGGRGITYADLLEVGLAEHKARSRYAQVPQEKRNSL